MLTPSSKVAIYFWSQVDSEQLDSLKKYIVSKKWELKSIYPDEKAVKEHDFAAFLFWAKKEGVDTVVVGDLSWLGESMSEVLKNIHLLKKSNLNFVATKEQFDTNTIGELFFDVFLNTYKGIKQIESKERKNKIQKGIELAKAKGKKLGRPSVPKEKIKEARELYSKGLKVKQIAKLLDIDQSTVRKKLKEV